MIRYYYINKYAWLTPLDGAHSSQIIQESNTYTGYIDNDPARPLPNFDGSFWFSSYGQVGNTVSVCLWPRFRAILQWDGFTYALALNSV